MPKDVRISPSLASICDRMSADGLGVAHTVSEGSDIGEVFSYDELDSPEVSITAFPAVKEADSFRLCSC
jgi:hypothetical protein